MPGQGYWSRFGINLFGTVIEPFDCAIKISFQLLGTKIGMDDWEIKTIILSECRWSKGVGALQLATAEIITMCNIGVFRSNVSGSAS